MIPQESSHLYSRSPLRLKKKTASQYQSISSFPLSSSPPPPRAMMNERRLKALLPQVKATSGNQDRGEEQEESRL